MSWGWARLAISAHATSPPATLPRHSCSLSVGLGLTPPLALGLSVGDASLYLDAMTPEGAGDEAVKFDVAQVYIVQRLTF